MIVVFLYPTQPPTVFETTRVQLMDHATDLAAHTATLPRGSARLEFDDAWALLSQDKKAAHQFADIASARDYLQADTRLTLHERTTVLSALERLERQHAAATDLSLL